MLGGRWWGRNARLVRRAWSRSGDLEMSIQAALLAGLLNTTPCQPAGLGAKLALAFGLGGQSTGRREIAKRGGLLGGGGRNWGSAGRRDVVKRGGLPGGGGRNWGEGRCRDGREIFVNQGFDGRGWVVEEK